MSSIFDPSAYLDAAIDQVQERRIPLPIGDYTAIVGEVTVRSWSSDKNGEHKEGIVFDLPLLIDIPFDVQEKVGYKTLTLKDGIMPDLLAGGALDLSPGKSGKLRLYREALDMNKVGEVFRPRAMQGRTIKVRIKHEDYEGWPQERVQTVSKI